MDLNQSLFSMYVSRKLSKIVERIQYKKTINVSVRKKDVGQTLHGQMKLYLAFSRPCEKRVRVGGRSPDDPSPGTLHRLLTSGWDSSTRQSLIWQEVSQTAIIIEMFVFYLFNSFFLHWRFGRWPKHTWHMESGTPVTWHWACCVKWPVPGTRHWHTGSPQTILLVPGGRQTKGKVDQEQVRIGGRQTKRMSAKNKEDQDEGRPWGRQTRRNANHEEGKLSGRQTRN